jgi:hypothetical protein
VVHMNYGEVSIIATQERWDKTKAIMDHIWEEFLILKVARESKMPEEDALSGMQHKQLERDRGFLIYVAQMQLTMVTYLKCINLNLDGRSGARDEQCRNKHGPRWKR